MSTFNACTREVNEGLEDYTVIEEHMSPVRVTKHEIHTPRSLLYKHGCLSYYEILKVIFNVSIA